MSYSFSAVNAAAKARRKAKAQESRNKGAARKAAALARTLGVSRVRTTSDAVDHARYTRDMGL